MNRTVNASICCFVQVTAEISLNNSRMDGKDRNSRTYMLPRMDGSMNGSCVKSTI